MSADQRAPQPGDRPPGLSSSDLAAFVDFMSRAQLKVGYFDADGNLLRTVPVAELLGEDEGAAS